MGTSMLPDQHRREIQYALEYAMLAILNQLPPHQQLMVKPGHPIPVPNDWKPCLKLPQKMLETQPSLQLSSHILQLELLIVKTRRNYNDARYITTALRYLAKAQIYLTCARCKELKARRTMFQG